MTFHHLIFLAATTLAAPAAFGEFALIGPSTAEALRRTPESPARTAAIRAGERQLDHAPHAMRRIHTEGTLPHRGIRDESIEAERDFPAALDLALAAALTGDARYSNASARILAAWLETYQPDFNPIDETNIDQLLYAYDLLPPDAKSPLAARFGDFAKKLAKGYFDSIGSAKGGTATNNWQSHRIKLATLAAYETGDEGLIKRARQAFLRQLGDNLLSNGETIDFEKRDAIHYVVYDLEPLLAAALAAKMHGDDWYALAPRSGGTLQKSLDWLAPFADGSKTHDEFVHSTVRFDYERRDAGVTGFSGLYDPKGARKVFAWAARLDARYTPLAEKIQADSWLEVIWPLKK
jgi:hypothetical protein